MATDITNLTPPNSSGSGAGYSPDRSHRTHHKPRKFSLFMKRLTSLKSSGSSSTPTRSSRSQSFSHSQKQLTKSPSTALSRASSNTQISFAVAEVPASASSTSLDSLTTSTTETDAPEHHDVRTIASSRSRPAPSAITTLTATTGARDSLFESPAPSIRSLTTTLTTITSTAPTYNPHASHHHNPNDPPVMYSAPFTATPGGPNADNASVWTLASSSRRPGRRRSVDTDASVRALAPSSVWGGSRESLPLSVLSANLDNGAGRSVYANSTLGRSSTLPPDAGSISGVAVAGPSGTGGGGVTGGRGTPGPGNPRSSLQLGGHSRRSSAWGLEVEGEAAESRKSEDWGRHREDEADMVSVKDDSSNVGVWRGVYGGRSEGVVV